MSSIHSAGNVPSRPSRIDQPILLDPPIQIHESIHHQALAMSHYYKRAEAELIEILEQVENHKVYLHYGYSSLFQYGIEELKLSENVIYNFIQVMRASRKVPALKLELSAGNITLSNAKRIAPVISITNQKEWIKKAATLSSRALEKEIVKVRPRNATSEHASYVTKSRIKLELGLFEKDMLELRRVQDLVSQTTQKAATLEDTLIEMTKFFLKHKDPIKKAKQVKAKKGLSGQNKLLLTQNPAQQVTRLIHAQNIENINEKNISENIDSVEEGASLKDSSQNSNPHSDPINSPKPYLKTQPPFKKRTPIPAHILYQVNLRDQRRCTHLSAEGKFCKQSRWTQIHHITPVSKGGKNTLENLTTLCSIHHRWVHKS